MTTRAGHAQSSAAGCRIVAIGASAGGIPALKRFFEAMPEDPGVAFVVVLHLSPSHESHLVEVLQRGSGLEVIEVRKAEAIRPDRIYVISPNSILTLTGDSLSARKPKTELERRHPVDALFRSLAEQRGAEAICLVLSGSGANGTAGAQRVREKDGLVLVQDPETAEHGEMPRNVIQAGWADRALAPEVMPEVVLGYIRGALPRLETAGEELARREEAGVAAILAVLRDRGGHDFGPYKKTTLVRRILRRMGLARIESFRHYADRLQGDPAEVRALVGDLMINVTGFFRDPLAWKALEEKVVGPLVAGREDGDSIRVWVPACSSGEEAYSVAMLLLRQAEAAGRHLDIKVFATDAAQAALARARAGVFAAALAETIPPALLERFFEKKGDLYRARKVLRDAVIFAPQNLLADPPFSRLDLVTCRNLLIYLEPRFQERVMALLHFSLREGGYLFLGTAETVGRSDQLFRPVSKKWRLYQRVGGTRHDLLEFPLVAGGRVGAQARAQARDTATLARRAPGEVAREALLQAFAPPSVLVDERHRVLYFHGDLQPYLRTPAGEPTQDLLALAREELRPRLRALIRQADKEQARVSLEAPVAAGEAAMLRIVASPVAAKGAPLRFLISFDAPPAAAGDRIAEPVPEPSAQFLAEGALEAELKRTREELRLSVEQLETSNEDLKASNEEITSMNEELQSTNEELETSKEELQSLNEELSTVNTQLQGKVEELEDRTNDLDNLLNSTEIATLFLDAELRIRWFTPPVRALFQVLPTDIGRPITDFAPRFDDDRFVSCARAVLRDRQVPQDEVRDGEGRWYLRRTLPYRTAEGRIDGVVVTFADITERRLQEEALSVARARAFAERIVNTTRQPLVVLKADFVVRSANRAFYETFRVEPGQVEGRILFEVDGGDWENADLRKALHEAVTQDEMQVDLEVVQEFRELGRRHLLVSTSRIEDEDLILLAIEDVTERALAEAKREVLVSELHHRVKNLLTKVQALVRLSQRGATSVEDFSTGLLERIRAIARTEELIGGRADGIALRKLVEAEMMGVAADTPTTIEGPDIRLSSSAAQILALALHELATNALKYGAFSRPEGQLRVDWAVEDPAGQAPAVKFRWVESGVPPSGEQRGGSFGLRLLKDLVPTMLGGRSEWELTEDGVRCLIKMPLSDKVSLEVA